MFDSLLPPNATPLEQSLDGTTSRVGAVPLPIRDIWNTQTCDVSLLPWLAWALGVNEWDSNWTEATKRAVIASSAAVHKIKGTPASIKQVLAAAGYPDAEIIEGVGTWNLDGSVTLNGENYLGDTAKWAWYRVVLPNPIANSQAQQVMRILANTAPARCYLEALDFSEAAFILDGSVKLDGTYNMGIVSA